MGSGRIHGIFFSSSFSATFFSQLDCRVTTLFIVGQKYSIAKHLPHFLVLTEACFNRHGDEQNFLFLYLTASKSFLHHIKRERFECYSTSSKILVAHQGIQPCFHPSKGRRCRSLVAHDNINICIYGAGDGIRTRMSLRQTHLKRPWKPISAHPHINNLKMVRVTGLEPA